MKNLLGALAILVSIVSTDAMAQLATVNTVYIEQTGGGSTIDLTQTGSQNEAGNSGKALIFDGNNQTISISQVGALNIAKMDIRGNNAQVTSLVTGSSNEINVTCGATGSTACTDAIIEANIVSGNSNKITTTTNAKSITKTNITAGDHNQITTTNSSNNTLGAKSEIINTSGDYNIISVTQSGPAGANGFNNKIETSGVGNNTITVVQSGSVDSNVNIKSSGLGGNTITVHSGN